VGHAQAGLNWISCASRGLLRSGIFDYIDGFYTPKKRLGYRSPGGFESASVVNGSQLQYLVSTPNLDGILSLTERAARSGDDRMAYVVTHFFEGGTKEQYEVVVDAAHPGGALPAGQTYHAAGPTECGWLVVSVGNSKGECDHFVGETLMPTLTSVQGGLAGPPQQRAQRSQT
jgi:hypothetical protein